MAGYLDQYDQTPVNPDPIKPIVPDDSKNQTNNTGKGECVATDGVDCPDDNIHPHTPLDMWIKENETIVIVGASVFLLLILFVVYMCCCRKTGSQADPYMNKAYSVNDDMAQPLDHESFDENAKIQA